MRGTPKFTTIKEFCEISGMGETWFRNTVLHHHMFKEHVYRPNRIYRIDTIKGLEVLREVMRDLEQGVV